MKQRILIIPDLHFPFTNLKALETVLRYVKTFQPNYVVQIGDLYDHYSFSKFRRSLELTTPEEEISFARKLATNMWKSVKKLASKAKCFQLLGNHDERLMKRVLDKLPELESLTQETLSSLYTFKGVTTVFDSRDYVEIDGIVFTHGYMSGLGKHLKQINQSVVIGHSHQGGVYFEQHKNKILFELNAGHLADTKSLPLSYTPIKISRSTLGFGIIEDNKPQFIPLA
jgi:predicted phosphodiesterase